MTVLITGNMGTQGKLGTSVYIIKHKYCRTKICWYTEITVTTYIEVAKQVELFAPILMGKTFCRGGTERAKMK